MGLHACEEPGAAAALPVDAAVRQPTRAEGQGAGAAQTHPKPALSERRETDLPINVLISNTNHPLAHIYLIELRNTSVLF